MGKSVHENITAALIAAGADLNGEDQVYRTDAGLVVKVKVLHDEQHSAPGHEIFRIIGAECDDNGKALVRDGRPAVHRFGRHLTAASSADTDLVTALEIERFAAVDDTVRAAANYRNRDLTGVGSMAQFTARHEAIPAPA